MGSFLPRWLFIADDVLLNVSDDFAFVIDTVYHIFEAFAIITYDHIK